MKDKELLVTAAQIAGEETENNPFWQAVEVELDRQEKDKPVVEPRKLQETYRPE